MGKGKLAAQVGHASVEALLKTGVSHPQHVDAWLATGQKKICVKVPGDEVMNELQEQAIRRSIPSLIVRDAGHTQIPQGSQTVLALGPYDEDVLDLLTGDLKLL
ncbi:MAG: aminoacyl-tRNA hydrolase [Candidatus Poseidonia sp.]|nr:aminoacyl-tRNA hydrolase [Poseidonia sp.]MBL6806702.1 aminoacyl-tRNA hydrolase [Poseidonia sp.]